MPDGPGSGRAGVDVSGRLEKGRRHMWIRRAPLLVAALIGLLSTALVAPALAEDSPPGRLVSEVAASGTPHVLDGRVLSVTKVGNTVLLGGDFSQARNDNSQTVLARSNLLAFNATTGAISTSFVPNPNGVVQKIVDAGDNETVYVVGNFTSIGNQSRSRVARVRISDGQVVTTFNAGTVSGQVRDAALRDGRLWIGGAFTHVGGRAQRALATLNPTTGAPTTFMSRVIAGNHNDGVTQVLKFDITPDGDRLVAVGNFHTLDDVVNHQLLMLDTSGASAEPADFRTSFYEARCSTAFDSYMRDVDFSPDGRFFVVSTTGAYGGSSGPCDTTARFETASSGAGIRPSWVNYTGGDTTYGVEVTDSAVYVGGHFRWQNNAFRGDNAGQGAVAREGIAALDPINGLPFSWNPGRTKGVGVFDFLDTPEGLWVASDTDRIGNWQLKSRIARMNPNGVSYPRVRTPGLPNDLYGVGTGGSIADPSILYRVNAAGAALPADIGPSWQADTAGSPSPYHNAGQNRAGYTTVPSVDSTVPAGTPRAVFDDELWDAAGGQEQEWAFPVPAGTEVKVRMYFANRCTCTQQAGQRVFHVDVEGGRVLTNFDIVASVGHDRGTMREFTVTSDGTVNIRLVHVVENPLVNAIEIVRADTAPVTTVPVSRRAMTNSSVGEVQSAPSGSVDWLTVRGAFMLNGWLYTAHSDGTFKRRTFDGSMYGAPQAVDASEQIVPFPDWSSDLSTMTGLFYDSGRIYFTRSGSNQLFYRYFTAESGVVGAQRLVASANVAGIDFAQVRGMFGTGEHLWWTTSDGNLRRIDWAQGPISGAPVGGTATVRSGPGVDGTTWGARAWFLFQDSSGNGTAPNQEPTASFTVSCSDLTCSFDASGSSDPEGPIASYAWDFGDGATGSGATAQHTYAAAGSYEATLTVTDGAGATAQTQRTAAPTDPPEPPDAEIGYVGADAANANSTTHRVRVPASVQPGDTLVLQLAVNSTTPSVTGPAGWTQLEQAAEGNVQGRLWTRTATASDADSLVTVTLSSIAKADLTVAAYRSTAGGSEVVDSGVLISTATATSLTAPGVVTTPGSWVSTYWAVKSSSTTSLSTTGGGVRESTSGSGGGAIYSLTADSDGVVPTGPQAGRVATADPSVTRLVAFSVAIGLTDGQGPVIDPEEPGDPDPEEPDPEEPDPEEPDPGTAEVAHVGGDAANANSTTHRVRVPASVQAGDTLVLALAVNSTTPSITGPAGWTQLEQAAEANVQGRLWTRTATASDADSLVTVTLSSIAKADLTVTAYRSSGGSSVVDSAVAVSTASTTSLTAPAVVATPGSWVSTYWAVKSSSDTSLSTTGGGVREATSGSGGGAVFSLTADSDGVVPSGPQAGRVATASPSVTRAVMFSVVIGQP